MVSSGIAGPRLGEIRLGKIHVMVAKFHSSLIVSASLVIGTIKQNKTKTWENVILNL